jgi:hypothetical protein
MYAPDCIDYDFRKIGDCRIPDGIAVNASFSDNIKDRPEYPEVSSILRWCRLYPTEDAVHIGAVCKKAHRADFF